MKIPGFAGDVDGTLKKGSFLNEGKNWSMIFLEELEILETGLQNSA
jgi:hypothetical protein